MDEKQKKLAKDVFAHISASYVKKELDRGFYDASLRTPIGQKIVGLPPAKKKALEFLLYAVSAAVVVSTKSDAGALRSFINDIISDLPSEFAKRFQSEDAFDYEGEFAEVLNDISDNEILQTYVQLENMGEKSSEFSHPAAVKPTFLRALAKKLETTNEKIIKARKDIS